MIILVDMDGPIADFNGLFFQRCSERGYALDCTLDDQTHKFATKHIVDKSLHAEARAMVYEDGWFAQLPIVAGAKSGLEELTDWGDVWICTKPLEANRTCRDDKARWVVENLGPEWERRLIITPDKSLIAGNLLLDDGPDRRWYSHALWHPVIFDAPFNRAGSKWERDDRWTWGQDMDELMSMATPWYRPSSWVPVNPGPSSIF